MNAAKKAVLFIVGLAVGSRPAGRVLKKTMFAHRLESCATIRREEDCVFGRSTAR